MPIDMKDMAIPKKSKKELKEDMSPVSYEDRDRWPYGLRLDFRKEQIAKLPMLKTYEVGDTVIVYAEAKVTSVRISEQQDKEQDYNVELQIEKLGLAYKGDKKPEKMSPKEYKKFREG
jgi:hypothetical protein